MDIFSHFYFYQSYVPLSSDISRYKQMYFNNRKKLEIGVLTNSLPASVAASVPASVPARQQRGCLEASAWRQAWRFSGGRQKGSSAAGAAFQRWQAKWFSSSRRGGSAVAVVQWRRRQAVQRWRQAQCSLFKPRAAVSWMSVSLKLALSTYTMQWVCTTYKYFHAKNERKQTNVTAFQLPTKGRHLNFLAGKTACHRLTVAAAAMLSPAKCR